MEENHHLLRPLLNPSTTTSSASPPLDDNALNAVPSNSGIIFRLTFVLFIGILSIWANHESSKGYAITILNDSGDTFAGRRFHLFYQSNDEASRIVIKASNTIQKFLYPDYDSVTSEKIITSVIIRLADRNLTEKVNVESGLIDNEFVINISPSVFEGQNFGHDMNVELAQGVARMWLWSTTPKAKSTVDGIVEYLVNNLICSGSSAVPRAAEPPGSNSGVVAEFLNRCERRRPGFVRRLNRAMRDGWDGALDQPVHDQCTTYDSLSTTPKASGTTGYNFGCNFYMNQKT